MRVSRQLFTLGLMIMLITALVASPASGAQRGTGRIIASYRPSDSKAIPAWAQQAIEHGRDALASIASPDALAVHSADLDDLDIRHVRFDQLYRNLPVFGGQLVAHLSAEGKLLGQSGHFYGGIHTSAQPILGPQTAIARAREALGYTGQFVAAPTAQLLILPLDSSYILAYQVTLKIEDGTDATAHHQYFINARDGSIALSYDSLPHDSRLAVPSADATGTGNSLYSGQVTLHTDSNGSIYALRDTTRGGMFAVDKMNRGRFGRARIFTDSDNVWGDGTNSDRQSAAVDAQFGAAETWDYYLNVHGRLGIDGNGYQIESRVHYGDNYNNAFWNGTNMTYGDGDGVDFSPLVALDVAGHEITHGVTSFTAGLIYMNESGASNESFSDIFGTAVEFYAGGAGGRPADYFIGEDIYLQPDTAPGFRNMQDPLEDDDPDNYSIRAYPGPCAPSPLNDNCGVHTNSGIQNNAFYLLAEGGTNHTSGLAVTGITRAKAENIFFRALTVYLTPTSNFHDVREACLSAASDLYGNGSPEYNATADAWTAVGVS